MSFHFRNKHIEGKKTLWDVVRFDTNIAKSWDSFVSTHPKGEIFHYSIWLMFLQEFCQAPMYLLRGIRNNIIIGGIPFVFTRQLLMGRRLLSLPYTDRNMTLIESSELPGALQVLLSFSFSQNVGTIEIKDKIMDNSDLYFVGFWHSLNLSGGSEAVWNKCSKTQIKQRIRKNRKNGAVAVETRYDLEALREFYQLHIETRQRLRTLPQPWRFFELLWKWIGAKGHAQVKVARAGSEAVAAAVFIFGMQRVTYKYSASRSKYWSLHPNHVLLWDAIESFANDGFRSFEFGRTGFHNAGLRSFKLSWGSSEESLSYWRPNWHGLIRRRAASFIFRESGRMLSHMPPRYAKAASKMLYPILT